MMKTTLIVGTSYIGDEPHRELAKLWLRVARHLNPDADIMLIDSGSPFDPREFLSGIEIFRFDDNIGAISQGQRDGSGRAFSKALEIAIERGYDYVMPWEADVIFCLPAEPIIEKMYRTGVKVCAAFATPYQFVEWGFSFWSTEYVQKSRYIERYDWPNSPKWPIPEFRNQYLTQDELFILPIHGYRNSMNNMNIANLTNLFPYVPPCFLTHCIDHNLYYRMLDLNGIKLA
jgi:hypothetical protein